MGASGFPGNVNSRDASRLAVAVNAVTKFVTLNEHRVDTRKNTHVLDIPTRWFQAELGRKDQIDRAQLDKTKNTVPCEKVKTLKA